jgi:hypothetical protein
MCIYNIISVLGYELYHISIFNTQSDTLILNLDSHNLLDVLFLNKLRRAHLMTGYLLLPYKYMRYDEKHD